MEEFGVSTSDNAAGAAPLQRIEKRGKPANLVPSSSSTARDRGWSERADDVESAMGVTETHRFP